MPGYSRTRCQYHAIVSTFNRSVGSATATVPSASTSAFDPDSAQPHESPPRRSGMSDRGSTPLGEKLEDLNIVGADSSPL